MQEEVFAKESVIMDVVLHFQVFFSLPNPNPYSPPINAIAKPYNPPFFFSSSSLPNGFSLKLNPHTKQTLCTKRTFNFSILALILNGSLPAQAFEMELERYTDSKEGFTLLKPSSYVRVEKAGATVLFEELSQGSNNVGVVVSPVRLSSLADFGTPQFVADKLIQAEKRKESTKDAEVIGVAERTGHKGLQVYEFEYRVDSTRGGMKRIFSAAFVSSKKLYILNIVHSDKPENPLVAHTRMLLEKVLHSFDAVPVI